MGRGSGIPSFTGDHGSQSSADVILLPSPSGQAGDRLASPPVHLLRRAAHRHPYRPHGLAALSGGHRPWEDDCDAELRRPVTRFHRRDFKMLGYAPAVVGRRGKVARIPAGALRQGPHLITYKAQPMVSFSPSFPVIPAKAGRKRESRGLCQGPLIEVDSRFRGNDGE